VLAAHLGLRPLECRLAIWGALGDGVFSVGKARTKVTGRRTRVIAVPDATMRELRSWRMRSGRPADDQPIVGPMSENAMKCWGRGVLRRAIKVASNGRIEDGSLYLLRHSHASSLHYCSTFTVPEAARRMGHGAELHLRTYAHAMETMSGRCWPDLDAMISAARADLGSLHRTAAR
jgi:integrase